MKAANRREFIKTATLGALAGGALVSETSLGNAGETKPRKMTIDLTCGSIGVSANQGEAIELAGRHGFESIAADGSYLASLPDNQLSELKTLMQAKKIVFGSAGLPVEFRQDDIRFRDSLKGLPRFALGLQR